MDPEIVGKHFTTVDTTFKQHNKQFATEDLPASEKGDILNTKSYIEKTEVGVPTATTKSLKKTRKRDAYSKSHEHKKEFKQKVRFLYTDNGLEDSSETSDAVPLVFKNVGTRSSLTNLHSLMELCPPPQPTLTHKQIRTLQLNEDQANLMVDQVSKMKTSMDQLQDIIQKFNCKDKFKHDIDFLVSNIGPAVAKAELIRKLEQAPCILHSMAKGEKRQPS